MFSHIIIDIDKTNYNKILIQAGSILALKISTRIKTRVNFKEYG